jgi:hypothetical protein
MKQLITLHLLPWIMRSNSDLKIVILVDLICQKQNSRTNIGSIQIVAHLKRFCLTYNLLKSDKK